jgi:OOP family OmpA-OmpF porin
MKVKSKNTFLILVSALLLAGCQAPMHNNTIVKPIATAVANTQKIAANLDSDGDGVLDDEDKCPGTPINVMIDENGCPPSLLLEGHLNMEYRAFFAKGSSELSKEYQLELNKIAQKLQEYETATMRIEGHASADEVSATDTGLQPSSLAENRALIVKNYLIMQHQIDPDRLSTVSYGAERPIAPSDTEEGKSMNRRVYGVAEDPLN